MSIEAIIDFIFWGAGVFLLVLGYVAGMLAEKRHYATIVAREKALLSLPVTTLKIVAFGAPVANAWLVSGSAVISADYFKRFIARLKKLIGGRLTTYESLIDRARREAVLRMKADAAGADFILNLRLETSAIGGNVTQRNSIVSIEAYAYGTAVKLTH